MASPSTRIISATDEIEAMVDPTDRDRPPLTVAERSRGYRRRKRERKQLEQAGRGLLTMEVDWGDLADRLVEDKLLRQWDAEDHQKIAAALKVKVALWLARHA